MKIVVKNSDDVVHHLGDDTYHFLTEKGIFDKFKIKNNPTPNLLVRVAGDKLQSLIEAIRGSISDDIDNILLRENLEVLIDFLKISEKISISKN